MTRLTPDPIIHVSRARERLNRVNVSNASLGLFQEPNALESTCSTRSALWHKVPRLQFLPEALCRSYALAVSCRHSKPDRRGSYINSARPFRRALARTRMSREALL